MKYTGYLGNTTSSIYEESKYNTRLLDTNEDDYIKLMGSLNLSYPALMHENLSANKTCGYNIILKNVDEKTSSKKIFDFFRFHWKKD
jgi:hypothetical protein